MSGAATMMARSSPVAQPAGIRRLAWIAYLALGLTAAGLYAAFPNVDHRWLFPLFGLGGAAAVFAGVFLHRPRKASRWVEVACGIALLALGDLTYSVLEAANGGTAPFPSIADAIYLAGYVILALGLAGLVGSRRGGRDVAGVLDALIVAGSVGVVAWVAFLSGTIVDAELNLGEVVALAYPFMDLVVLAMVIRLAVAPSGMGPGRLFLVAGVVAYLTSDFAYTFQSLAGTYEVGGVIDVGWAIGYVLWGATALHPRMIQAGQRAPAFADVRPSTVRIVGLGVAALIPPALLWLPGVAAAPEKLYGVAATSMALTVLVLARIANLFSDLNTSIVQRRRLEG